jgi:selenoprotein W-related protein
MAERPVKVTIAYCAECGYEQQTLALAGALMIEFQHRISSIEILPWFDGSFEVSVNGQLVHSMAREGGFPEHETVARAVREQLQGANERARGEQEEP